VEVYDLEIVVWIMLEDMWIVGEGKGL